MNRALILLLVLLGLQSATSHGEVLTLAGPANVVASDVPDDVGGQIMVKWSLSPMIVPAMTVPAGLSAT